MRSKSQRDGFVVIAGSFLLVSGLIPPRILDRAVDAMWYQMRVERRTSYGGPPLQSREPPLRRDDPSTWTEDWQGMVVNPEILVSRAYSRVYCLTRALSARPLGLRCTCV